MPRVYWTPEEDSLLTELVSANRLSFPQMSKKFIGRTGVSLQKRSLRLGLNRGDFIYHKHSYNQGFFETPNPINCYVAGFYAADGCIGDNPTTRYLSISLAEKDGHQVETFAKLLNYTGKVTTDPRGHWEGNFSDMRSLRLYSAYKITADLERVFGLAPSKTYRIPAPNIEDPHLKLCYLAGLLDGDGCIHISVINNLSISYTSCSLAIIQWVKEFIDSLKLNSIRASKNNTIFKESHSAAYRFTICGAKAIDLIERVQKLKLEGIPILDRKWDNPQLNSYIQEFKAKHYIIPSPSSV